MVDTSSLLPGHTAPRRHTHFLTLPSHVPGTTFVGTSTISMEDRIEQPSGLTNGSSDPQSKSSADFTLVTIPAQPDTLFPLLMQKMSPLWVPRQAHRVEGAVWFEIGDWKARIGDLKITGGLGQGRVRGCVCEVEFPGGDDWDEVEEEEEREGVARAFLEGLLQGSGVDLGAMKVVGGFAGKENRLVRQYMSLLRFGSA